MKEKLVVIAFAGGTAGGLLGYAIAAMWGIR